MNGTPDSSNMQRVAVNKLIAAPYNPRVVLRPDSPGYRRLSRSLDEFGLVQPIVWNERTGHVVSGHQRLQILKDRGATEVEVIAVSLSLEREKALNITMNNRQVGSDWDADKLQSLVVELEELPDFDATLTGFDEADIQDFLFIPNDDFERLDGLEEVETSVRVEMEISPDDWEDILPELDDLISRYRLSVHIQQPG